MTLRIPREKNAARYNPRVGDTCLMYNGNFRGDGDITHFDLTVTGVTKSTLLVSYLDEDGVLIENEDISLGVWAHARGSSGWKMGPVTHYVYENPKTMDMVASDKEILKFPTFANTNRTKSDRSRELWAPYINGQ